MNAKNRIVIIGATSGIAEACARLWVQDQTVDLTLVGRDPLKTKAVAADLRVRSQASMVSVMTVDFLAGDMIKETVDLICLKQPVDIVLIAHGTLPDQFSAQKDLALCKQTLEINAVSPVLFAEAFVGHMEKANRGTLGIIGSVAGDRGRKSNYIYGAAKGLVARYAQGLQHRLALSNVKVVLIKPGPTDTPMTASLKSQGLKVAPLEEVAKQIVKAMSAGQAEAYVPGKWKIIMRVIQHLPSFIFQRLNI